MKNLLRLASILILAILALGCAAGSANMRVVPESEAAYAPTSDRALVIFMRPSRFGGAIQSAIFDTTTQENKLVGIVSAKTKVAYSVAPGEHMFMVVGENADFMGANLVAGKTYYAVVRARMGVWKARFSLYPVHKSELGSSEFENWVSSCSYVENTDDSCTWARNNAADIQAKREAYIVKWEEKPDSDKPMLRPEDGV